MIGLMIKFKKQLKSSSICYDFFTSLGLLGSCVIEKDKVTLKNLDGEYSEKDKEELVSIIKKHLLKSNFPKAYTYAAG